MRRRFITTTLLNILSTIWSLALSFPLTPFILHRLGTDAYGVWVLAMSFSVLSGYLSLLDLGVQSALVKMVAEHHARGEHDTLNRVISAGLLLFTGLGIFAALSLAAFTHWALVVVFHIPTEFQNTAKFLLSMLAIQTVIEFPGQIFAGVLEGLQHYPTIRAVDLIRYTIYVIAIWAVISLGAGLAGMGLVLLTVTVARAGVIAVLVWRALPQFRLILKPGVAVFHRIAKFSGQILVIRMSAFIYGQMDTLIVATLLTTTQLVEYDIANRIQMMVLLTLTFVSSQVVPAASQLLAREEQAGLQQLFLKATKWTAALSMPAVAAACILAEPFIAVWIGPTYRNAALPTQIFVAHLLFVALTAVGYNTMIGMGKIKVLTFIQIGTTTVLNLGLSIVLTLWFGVIGVVLGTLIGTALSAPLYLWLFLRELGLTWARLWGDVILKIYPSVGLFALGLYVGKQALMLDSLWKLGTFGLVCGILYLGLLALFGLDDDERHIIIGAIRRMRAYLRASEA